MSTSCIGSPKNMEDGGHGFHLIVDCFNISNDDLLVDEEEISHLFSSLISTTNMTPVLEFEFYRFPSRHPLRPDEHTLCKLHSQLMGLPSSCECNHSLLTPHSVELEGGVTAFQVLAESHLSMHTFPSRRAFSLDLFSCRPFDCQKAVALISSSIGDNGNFKVSIVERSFLHSPRTNVTQDHLNSDDEGVLPVEQVAP